MTLKLSIITSLLSLLIFNSTVFSQKSKIGYIHTNTLWESMPEKAEADSILNELSSEMLAHYEDLNKQFKKKYSAFAADSSANKESAVYKSKLSELQQLSKEMETFKKNAETELAQKKQTLYDPIKKAMQDAIDIVAEKRGLEYVLDASFGTIIYRKEETFDLMTDVLKQLGIK